MARARHRCLTPAYRTLAWSAGLSDSAPERTSVRAARLVRDRVRVRVGVRGWG